MTDEQISELWQQAWNSMPDVARKPPTIPPVAIAFARALLDSSHLTEAVEQTVPGEPVRDMVELLRDPKFRMSGGSQFALEIVAALAAPTVEAKP